MGTTIQGRINDVSLMVGASVRDPADEATQAMLFRIYRYIALSHVLCYKPLKPLLEQCCDWGNLVRLGLATEQEARALMGVGESARCLLCGWIASEITDGLSSGRLNDYFRTPMIDQVARLRAAARE